MIVIEESYSTVNVNILSYVIIINHMDVVLGKNKKPKKTYFKKKIRLIISFLVIAIALCLLGYAIVIHEPIVLLVVIILIVKITDIVLNLHKIRRKTQICNNLRYNRET